MTGMSTIARNQVGAGESATRCAHMLHHQSVSNGVQGASLVQDRLTLAAAGVTENNNVLVVGTVRPPSRFMDGFLFGQIPESWDIVILVNNKHAVEKFLTTTKLLIKYVGKHYGQELKNLVKYCVKPTFTMLVKPNMHEHGAIMERYKAELAQVHKEIADYKKGNDFVFKIILGQCHPNVLSKLEHCGHFANLEMTNNILGFLHVYAHAMGSN